ncbi:hypothetical protein [Pimelobacter simplex]|uniref:hypothetical protein n=1 Tax=Nocardioides simplex TaxID=2045 RepID=UPI001375F27B|nr:hypothetical protein [Pimelobacter simplex]
MGWLHTLGGDVYRAALPIVLAGLGWLLVRFGRAVLKRLDQIADLPAAVDRLTDELAALRDDHEPRIARLETHLNGAIP